MEREILGFGEAMNLIRAVSFRKKIKFRLLKAAEGIMKYLSLLRTS